jgi:hypothetical protein
LESLLGVAIQPQILEKITMEVLESICCIGLQAYSGEADGQVFRMKNGNWVNADYQIGDKFEICDSSSMSGDLAIAPDGQKVWIPQSERQCFREVENA